MIKKIKRGFSLAEILIAVGIISVIATIGFSITTKSIERAYDLYIYNGYESLTRAVRDADINEKKLITNSDSEGNPVATTLNVENDFLKHLASVFDGKLEVVDNQIMLKVRNGVSYIFNETNSLIDINNNKLTLYVIKMQIPVKHKKENGSIKTSQDYIFYYVPESYETIFPANSNPLLSRMDLLPTYIDNGEAGHVIDGSYEPIVYQSFNNSICQIYSNLKFGENFIVTQNCAQTDSISGVIKIANPRKVF